MKQRDCAIDIAKAIGIILMVIGHCPGISGILRNSIFSFHMPLFFILSGYFYKEQETKIIITRNYNHLVKPYLITSIACIILCIVTQHYEGALLKVFAMFLGAGGGMIFGHKVPVIGPIWFLLALFWCKVVYNIICKKTKHSFVVCVVISTVSFVFGKYITTLPLGFLYGLCSLVFYSMGHYWKSKNLNFSTKMGICGISLWILCILKGHLEIADYSCSLYPISMIGAFVGTYMTYRIAKITPTALRPMLNWLGNNTLLILCYHTLYYYIMSLLNVYLFEPNNIKVENLTIVAICFALSFGLPLLHVSIKKMVQRNAIAT